jgi:hypothetical protein
MPSREPPPGPLPGPPPAPLPGPSGPRMSRSVKLALMGVAGAALLYSCAPGVGAALGVLPYPYLRFNRPPVATPCPPGTSDCQQQATQSTGSSGGSGPSHITGSGGSSSTADSGTAASSSSQRGGFGTTGSSGSS